MYRADYHTHSSCSPDGFVSMSELAEQAISVGLQELCITDHVDTILWEAGTVYGKRRKHYDWKRMASQFQEAQERFGSQIVLRLGAELGEVTQAPQAMEGFLQEAPPLDFCIGSVHTASRAYGWQDLFHIQAPTETEWMAICRDYWGEVLELCEWGRFDVLGHLTLPARYAWERYRLRLSFAPHKEYIAAIFRTLIDKGRGIEVNTNRGSFPLPSGEWLRLYRDLGGEVITIGSDAHTPSYIGCAVDETQELLRQSGFRYFTTFEKHQPIFHPLG